MTKEKLIMTKNLPWEAVRYIEGDLAALRVLGYEQYVLDNDNVEHRVLLLDKMISEFIDRE